MSIEQGKIILLSCVLILAGVAPAWAASPERVASAGGPALHMSADMKCGAAHHAMMQKPDLTVSTQRYTLPEVKLVDSAGKPVDLHALLEGDQPVAVNFIFTTCTTICPIMSATFAQMRRELGADAERIQLVSITIDPEHDTPAVLSAYAKRFSATPTWHFLTGTPKDIEQVLRTFDVWTGTKTNHRPITLMRRKGDSEWLRLEGLASGTSLAKQAQLVLH
jgi:protein SCO1/2